MTSRQLRLLRGAAASSIATIIAAVSHTIGGGAPPHPLLVIALSVFLTPLAALLVGRTSRLGGLGAAVLASQTVFHVLFVALGATVSHTASPGVMAGHHHVMTLGPSTSTVAPDAGMLGAHVVAVVLTIALLWRGEQLVRVVARWVRAVLRNRMPPLHADWPVPASFVTTARLFISTIRTDDISRRGPPVFSRG